MHKVFEGNCDSFSVNGLSCGGNNVLTCILSKFFGRSPINHSTTQGRSGAGGGAGRDCALYAQLLGYIRYLRWAGN
jgi:hypothetical protein